MSDKKEILTPTPQTPDHRLLGLCAWFGENMVATIEFNQGRVSSWKYTAEWLLNGFAVAPGLPLLPHVNGQIAEQYLRNLFPEGQAFDLLAEHLGSSKTNTQAMLSYLGKEVSGALRFLPRELAPDRHFCSLREISPEEMTRRVNSQDMFPLCTWDNKVRLSVAGLQQKINLFLDEKNNLMGLPDGALGSTHILKIQKRKDDFLAINEWVMLETARLCGLKTCKTKIVDFEGIKGLLIERFDRSVSDTRFMDAVVYTAKNGISPEKLPRFEGFPLEYFDQSRTSIPYVGRRHFVDACQAFGLPPEYKYERNLGDERDVKDIREGVSFSNIRELINSCSNYDESLSQVLKWGIFNLIISNYDAHGKNISFGISTSGMEVAPFYDLVCIKALDLHLNETFAMAYGDNFNEQAFTKADLLAFAFDLGASESQLESEVFFLAKQIPASLFEVSQGMANLSASEMEFLQSLQCTIQEKARQIGLLFTAGLKDEMSF